MTVRYSLVQQIGTGTEADPFQPNVPGGGVTIGQRGDRVLVQTVVPNGTPMAANTIADLDEGALDVNATPLTAAQRTAAKTFLAQQGIDASRLDADGVTDRRALLRFLAKRWLGREDYQTLVDGYYVAEAGS